MNVVSPKRTIPHRDWDWDEFWLGLRKEPAEQIDKPLWHGSLLQERVVTEKLGCPWGPT